MRSGGSSGLRPVCSATAALAPGASATVVVTVRALAAGPLRNGVTAISATPTVTPPTGPTSPVAAPPVTALPARVAVAGVIARSGPGVTLRKAASRRVVRSGAAVTFTLTATARGGGTAHAVTICDRMPRGFTVVAAPGARRRAAGWCWTLGALASGASRTVRITARAPSAGAAIRRTNVAVLAYADRAPRFARARVTVVPPRAGFTG
jgi:uncharacterized repeat protein (TIGR01451 family)